VRDKALLVLIPVTNFNPKSIVSLSSFETETTEKLELFDEPHIFEHARLFVLALSHAC
jgi:hypothetical protein